MANTWTVEAGKAVWDDHRLAAERALNGVVHGSNLVLRPTQAHLVLAIAKQPT